MQKNLIRLVFILLFLSLFASKGLSLQIGQKVPDFKLDTLSGETFHLMGYDGPVMLMFWTTWCPYCVKEVSQINSLRDKYAQKGLEIIGINAAFNDSISKAKDFKEKYEPNYPIVFDKNSQVSRKYRIVGVPTIMVVDNSGYLIYQDYTITEDLKRALNKVVE